MKKLTIGAIIRTAGERTLKLCIDSVLQHILKKNIVTVMEAPFTAAMKKCVEIAKRKGWDKYLMIDADLILTKNWRDIVEPFLGKETYGVYEHDFDVQDRFIGKTQKGIYLVNSKYDSLRMEMLEQTKDMTKPEGSIRHLMGKEGIDFSHAGDDIIGYHGFNQYKKDIFNTFALRALRNKDYIERYKLFKGKLSKEERVARAGWKFGQSHPEMLKDFMDFTKKVDTEKMGWKEYDEVDYSLNMFYKLVEKLGVK